MCVNPEDGSGGCVRLFLALDTIDEANGCLRYLPGSHRSLRPHVLDRPAMAARDAAVGVPILTDAEQDASGAARE